MTTKIDVSSTPMQSISDSKKYQFRQILILYASETGQSESIARIIFETIKKEIFPIIPAADRALLNVQIHCVSQYEKFIATHFHPSISLETKKSWKAFDSDANYHSKLLNSNFSRSSTATCALDSNLIAKDFHKLLIIVASTTGQGDPPAKAKKFFRWLKKLQQKYSNLPEKNDKNFTQDLEKPFDHLVYALLGLGDSNYDNFVLFSKNLNKILSELGAKKFIDPAFADDAVGLELVTEPFIKTLIANIKSSIEYVHRVSEPNQSIAMKNDSNCSSASKSKINGDSADALTKKFQNIININKPVVSACQSLSSSDKCHFSEICRQLLEPSPNLIGIENDLLETPKYTAESVSKLLVDKLPNRKLIYSKKDLEKSSFKYEFMTIKDILEQRVSSTSQKSNTLTKGECKEQIFEGSIKLKKQLNKNYSSLCCHRDKIVLECEIHYNKSINSGHVKSNGHQKAFIEEFSNEQNKSDEMSTQTTDFDDYNFAPGDSYGFFCANSLIDVFQVLISVKVCNSSDDDSEDNWISLWNYFKANKKKVYVAFNEQIFVELVPYLFFGLDLRAMPKKSTLFQFSRYTRDSVQRRRLQELSSRQGNEEYQNLILNQNITICDIIRLFDSCHPPLNVFLDNVPASKPRYYSIANIPEIKVHHDESTGEFRRQTHFRIILSIANQFSHTFMRASENLLGHFSGKFFRHYHFVSENFQIDLKCSNVWDQLEAINKNVSNGNIFEKQDVKLSSSSNNFPVYLFRRANTKFRLPISISEKNDNNQLTYDKPKILISTGTGIAPFLSYLEVLSLRKKSIVKKSYLQPLKNNCLTENHKIDSVTEPFIFFIFGCRNPEDFIYSKKIISYHKESKV
ncbi:Methionine synthase reductase [Sarcoptes scabiei]|uniref:Methionine synthase reductase n=1 Tax=Sarcoptes scabiei TaxID=52283 RepID=A0A834RE76_SARSC|nr:Methionine synthase reductase [Sarcoptes scabiei]